MKVYTKIQSFALATAVAVGAIAAMPTEALAEFPEKPVTIMVGYSAGGGTDSYARGMASFAHETLGQPMIIVNRPGAASMIAAKAVKDAPADGYTLLVVNGGTFLAGAMLKGDDAPADPLRDMQPLGGIGQFISGMLVAKNNGYNSPQDVIAAAKANPGSLRWAHPGRGSINMLAGALFLIDNGITAKDVPFDSGPAARNAALSGQVDYAFTSISNFAGFEDKGMALGVSHTERDPVFKDVPTFAELDLPALGVTGPMVVWGSKDMPEEAVTKLVASIKEIAEGDGYQRVMKRAGAAGFYLSPEDILASMENMQTRFGPIIKDIKAQQ